MYTTGRLEPASSVHKVPTATQSGVAEVGLHKERQTSWHVQQVA